MAESRSGWSSDVAGAPTIRSMAFSLADRAVRGLTADEVLAMVQAGILSEDEPVELLHGVLTRVSPKSPQHEAVKARLNRWLSPAHAAGACKVRIEAPILVPDPTSLPEPDLLVLAADHDDVVHPTTALLVIEVAVTSLGTDTEIKPTLYAAAGVPELWVVDVTGRCVRTFTDPHPDGYATRDVRRPGEQLHPARVPVEPLDLEALLHGIG